MSLPGARTAQAVRRLLVQPVVLALGLLSPAVGLAQAKPDYKQIQPRLNGHIPREVPRFPISSFPIDTRPLFDYFAWQNFIAVMWPAQAQDLGAPYKPDDASVFGRYSPALQPVWLRWKTAYDLYPQDGSTPPAWEQPNGFSPCRNLPRNNTLPMLDMVTKFDTLADELDEAFSGPLPDQTGLFTRFEVRFNRAEYDYVRGNGFYNKANWPTGAQPPISFPASTRDALGAIEVKAAWRDLSKVPAKFHSRFFTLEALGTVAGTCKTVPNTQKVQCDCRPMKLGLVGIHINHKTADFPQWVWSTFEQVDNLGEDATTPRDMQPSYFDPDFYKKYPDKKAPGRRSNPPEHPGSSRVPGAQDYDSTPVNVVRLSAIPDTPKGNSTVELNARYRQLFKGTVWENYQLIGTQWSTQPSVSPQSPLVDPVSGQQDFGCEDGTPAAAGGVPFPACQVANVTMETYHQYDSCQNCHQGAQRSGADFSWSLALRAYSPPAPAAKSTPAPAPTNK